MIRKQLTTCLIYRKHLLTSLIYFSACVKSKESKAAINRKKREQHNWSDNWLCEVYHNKPLRTSYKIYASIMYITWRGAVVEWYEQLDYGAESRRKVVGLRPGFAMRRLENCLCQPSNVWVPFFQGCQVVRWSWVNFQCRGILQFG